MRTVSLLCASLLIFSLQPLARAQEPGNTHTLQVEESAPEEPPFTREENEFDSSLEVPVESSTPVEAEAPAVIPAEPSPVVNEGSVSASKKSEPVARKSGKGGVDYVQHPQSAKGLMRIEKDGTYIYKTEDKSSFTKTGTLRIGTMDAPKIISKDGATNFETMYHGSPVPVVLFDYEWQPFTSFGRLGLQAGMGFLVSQGNGRFACSNCGTLNGTEAKETYTFVAIPINLGGVYRMEWVNHQWVSPYLSGGGTYIPIVELRDDNSSPHGVGTPGVYGAGGLMFNISALDRDTRFILRNEYSIANLWLTAEYRYLKTFNQDLDFSSNILTLGIGVDY